jgi:hypothetical protein
VIKFGLSLGSYLLLRVVLGDGVWALVLASCPAAAPAVWALAHRRRPGPFALVGLSGLTAGLALLAVTGGDETAFRLREPVVTGLAGLACLLSLAAGRPLSLYVVRLVARTPAPRAAAAVTAIAGVTLLVHASVVAALALTLPTATFLIAAKAAGWPIYAAGGTALLWYRRRIGRTV